MLVDGKKAAYQIDRIGLYSSVMAKIDPVRIIQPWESGWGAQQAHLPTTVTSPAARRIVRSGELLADGSRARADTNVYSISVTVMAKVDGWQPSPLVLAAGETALITAQGQWQVIPPNWTGPEGHAGIPAYGPTPSPYPPSVPWVSGGYLVPGAVEGCLLVQDGTGFVQAFGPPGLGSDPVIVHAPGRI